MNPVLNPRDIIAIIVIISATILKILGADGGVSLILISVVAYYFGLQQPSPTQETGAKTNTNPTEK